MRQFAAFGVTVGGGYSTFVMRAVWAFWIRESFVPSCVQACNPPWRLREGSGAKVLSAVKQRCKFRPHTLFMLSRELSASSNVVLVPATLKENFFIEAGVGAAARGYCFGSMSWMCFGRFSSSGGKLVVVVVVVVTTVVCVAESWPVKGREFSSPSIFGFAICNFAGDLDIAEGASFALLFGDFTPSDSAVVVTRALGLVAVRVSRIGGSMWWRKGY